MVKPVVIFNFWAGIKMVNFCQQILKPGTKFIIFTVVLKMGERTLIWFSQLRPGRLCGLKKPE